MIAFVLSGGGSQGALQVGALKALIERDIRPDIIVGTSVGAINGVCLAFDPSTAMIEHLARSWCELTGENIYPGNYATALWRLARGGDGFYLNRNLKLYLMQHTPDGIRKFSDLQGARLYVIATKIPQGQIRIFGEDQDDNVLDAIMASASLPPLHPPYEIDGQFYLDGSLSANLPLKIAIDKGATTIYSLHIFNDLTEKTFNNGALSISLWAILKLLQNQAQVEVERAGRQPAVTLHDLKLTTDVPLSLTDFSHSDQFIRDGYIQAKAYLDNLPAPITLQAKDRWQRTWNRLATAPQFFRQAVERFAFTRAKTETIDPSVVE